MRLLWKNGFVGPDMQQYLEIIFRSSWKHELTLQIYLKNKKKLSGRQLCS